MNGHNIPISSLTDHERHQLGDLEETKFEYEKLSRQLNRLKLLSQYLDAELSISLKKYLPIETPAESNTDEKSE